ncbi:hypothetical protein PENSUB_1793 [Penicillium subrubescens]|uniref:Uncharacterized protein n=1 Tax=Penicillium subrubescens TaxID=1316194 RepID=A0A1Q5UJA9_9EURO|nr:hypothetical protein PENSUB_1793 [Penicillium subrubescens]
MQLQCRILLPQVPQQTTPWFVIVDAHDGGEYFAGGGFEAKHSRGTAASHEQHMLTVVLGPGASIGIVPAGFFDNYEGVRGAVLDTETDSIGHCSAAGVSILLKSLVAYIQDAGVTIMSGPGIA